jgi:hypothetical protein
MRAGQLLHRRGNTLNTTARAVNHDGYGVDYQARAFEEGAVACGLVAELQRLLIDPGKHAKRKMHCFDGKAASAVGLLGDPFDDANGDRYLVHGWFHLQASSCKITSAAFSAIM